MALAPLVPLLAPGVRYYILRDDIAVPLVPVDQIPACIKSLSTSLSPGRCKIEGWQLVGETQQSARLLEVDSATSSEFLSRDYTARFRNDSRAVSKKEYCSHWIRTNSCDFAQDGCKYKHEMPDLATLRRISFDDYPPWWKKKMSSRVDVGLRPRSLPRSNDQEGHLSVQTPTPRAFNHSPSSRSTGRPYISKAFESSTSERRTATKGKASASLPGLIDICIDEDRSNIRAPMLRANQALPHSRGLSRLRAPEKNRASPKEAPADETTTTHIPNLIDFDDDQSMTPSSSPDPRVTDVHPSALPARPNHNLAQPTARAPDMLASISKKHQVYHKRQSAPPRMLGESRYAVSRPPSTRARTADMGDRSSEPAYARESVVSWHTTTSNALRERSPKSKKQSKSRSKGASSPPIHRTSHSKGRIERERDSP
ncbi:hypothetical protein E8E13_000032 [Curvularia kusanoi]|uniref:C3H1-type domain-containing protein n=1 Tax=Curvularia kusanoi TaxID=90978 RepID=A0A9P4W3T5_CURKU|nr:hypothetical protein E8E13_000032 [Curvularia kusanoi]